ncbi:hypothetical protein SRS16CHR_03580 [Variovorax sp. SRS16]|uniref:hypothetical protein n=1 Tax=Variovorax sp. SRS16 TaxID=282217 RepID=UPI001316C2CC|nr:hypothetical protein [Variovorax sp. SRS16]VTU25039.1 hypothetical protein SRS16CHR_03580 [Variovorax sp. SRS16]
MTNEHQDPEPTDEVKALTADLLDRLALDADGQPYDDNNPGTWAEADAAEPEVVRLGQARFKIIDADAQALALAAGAVEDGAPPALCMRVAFDQAAGQPQPCAGQYVTLQADEKVTLIFRVWITHADLHDQAAPDFGADAQRDPVLYALQPGEALLVQVLPQEESEAGQ